MIFEKYLNLQLFGGEGGEGAAAPAGGEADATGVNTVDAEQQRLLELGVPADKLRKRANKKANSPAPVKTVANAPEQVNGKDNADGSQVASADVPTEEASTNKRMTWDEILADPEYNKQMQAVVQARLKNAKGAEETLAKVAPSLELLARKYGLEAGNIDYDALNKAIEDEDEFYETKALEMGVSVDTAKKIDQTERANQRQERETARNLEEQKIRNHLTHLEEQSKVMQKTFPNFNLREELKNPAFARMTAPDINMPIEDAYYAVHRKEIQAASMQVAAQKTAEQISNAIQSGRNRPQEAGINSQAPSVSSFDYRNASKEQREALKKAIRNAALRGEKLYPGQR